MDTLPKYNKNRLIAPANPECVPVPKAWIKRLLEINKQTTSYSQVSRLQGYIESASGFLKEVKEETNV